ncbi:MAG: glycosyltransferase family 4 protein [Alistipes sp.]|nr:glycosyltransferase family 4 protein [Alistipes sp.]
MKRTHTLGFDAKYANAQIDDMGSYGRFIVRAVATAYPENAYLRLYTPTQIPNSEYEALTELPNVESMEPDGSLWRRLSTLWRMWRVTKDAQHGDVELFHGLANSLPYGLARKNIRSVVSVHDLQFIRDPKQFNILERIIRYFEVHSACVRADRIIAASEATKRDIHRLLGINPEKVDVVYQGCNPIFSTPVSQADIESVKEKYELPEHYILNVGDIEERKNIGLILDAMAELPEDVELVIIGNHTRYSKRIKRRIKSLGLEQRVHIRNIPLSERPAAYKGADIFIYPSRFEGFALEILEAITVGVPVIATRGSSHEEAGGVKSIYVSPRDCGELAEAIELLRSNPAKCEEMIAAGKNHTRLFRSEVAAYGIMKCYERIGVELGEL